MKIKQLHLRNFRNFEHIDLSFHPEFTAVIGINGRGKSSILYALRVAVGAYMMGLGKEVRKIAISPEDIRIKDYGSHIVPQKPVEISVEGQWHDGEELTWRREIGEESNTTTSSQAHVGAIRDIAKHNYKRVMKDGKDDVVHPVLAYFGTNRLSGGGRNTMQDKPFREVFKDGYDHWYDMQFNTFQYERWFRNHRMNVINGKESSELMDAFLQAIMEATPMINLRVEGGISELWFKSKIKGDETDYLPMSYHSDGLRTYVAMVAEIAYRCIVLNMHLGKRVIKESPGVVLIDELDMHLHPNWQKHVAEDLKRAFPSIQFIISTHSPFIVQSLEAEELLNLDTLDISRNTATPTMVDPQDLSLNKVVTDIMQVDSIKSDDFEDRYQEALKAFEELQSQGYAPTMEYYQKLKEIVDDGVITDSNDPVYKAYLTAKKNLV